MLISFNSISQIKSVKVKYREIGFFSAYASALSLHYRKAYRHWNTAWDDVVSYSYNLCR